MENLQMYIEGEKLTIEIDLSKRLRLSKSGKNQVIATTLGNVEVPGRPEIRIGINCYTKGEN